MPEAALGCKAICQTCPLNWAGQFGHSKCVSISQHKVSEKCLHDCIMGNMTSWLTWVSLKGYLNSGECGRGHGELAYCQFDICLWGDPYEPINGNIIPLPLGGA